MRVRLPPSAPNADRGREGNVFPQSSEAFAKVDKSKHMVEVAGDSKRDADRPVPLVWRLPRIIQREARLLLVSAEAAHQFRLRQAERRLAASRIEQRPLRSESRERVDLIHSFGAHIVPVASDEGGFLCWPTLCPVESVSDSAGSSG